MINKSYSQSLDEGKRSLFEQVEAEIENALPFFPELGRNKICIYFYSKDYINRKHAQFYPLRHPRYHSRIGRLEHFAEFLIVFSKKIASLKGIEQFYIICHELQHVVQFANTKREYLYSCLIRDFGDEGNGVWELKVPTEIDADRKAKAILLSVFGKREVKKFIEELASSGEPVKGVYGEHLNLLDLEKEYILEDEVRRMWDKMDMKAVVKKPVPRPRVPASASLMITNSQMGDSSFRCLEGETFLCRGISSHQPSVGTTVMPPV
jgi:hypothetical protein